MRWAAQAGVLTPWRSTEERFRRERRRRTAPPGGPPATESEGSLPDSSPAPLEAPEMGPHLDWEEGDDPGVQRFISMFFHDGPPLPFVPDEAAEDSDAPLIVRSRPLSTRVSQPNPYFSDFV